VRALPDYYDYWAGWADKIHGEVVPLDRPNIFHYLLREPVGIIAAVVSWNSPFLLLTWKQRSGVALTAGRRLLHTPRCRAGGGRTRARPRAGAMSANLPPD